MVRKTLAAAATALVAAGIFLHPGGVAAETELERADINLDGYINQGDVLLVSYTDEPRADVNRDGGINVLDIAIVLKYYNQPSGLKATATPTSAPPSAVSVALA